MNTTKNKNPAAVALGKLGKGHKHKSLTPEQRAAAGQRGSEAFKIYWRERLALICKNNTAKTNEGKQ